MPRQRKRKTVMISYVAKRYEIHPQTLRTYEREGLLKPIRSDGNTRLYDEASLRRLETILTLTRDMGINLAGVEVILNLQDQLASVEAEKTQLIQILEKRDLDRRAGITRRHALVKVDRGPLMKIDD